jgi:hypothetical protein
MLASVGNVDDDDTFFIVDNGSNISNNTRVSMLDIVPVDGCVPPLFVGIVDDP